MSGRTAFLLVFFFGAVVSVSGTLDHGLWPPDEPRVAEIGREMYESGDYVVPRLGGEAFLEKPPLYWWGMSGLYAVFGVSASTARATSIIAAFLLLLLAYDTTRRLATPLAGLLAAVVLATIPGFVVQGLRCTVDAWLALFVFLGYRGFLDATVFQEEGASESAAHADGGSPGRSPRARGLAMMYASAGLAFLTKGPVGVGLLFGTILVYLLWNRQWRWFRAPGHIAGLVLCLASFAIWPLLLSMRGGMPLMNGFVVNNIWYRFSSPIDGSYGGGHVRPAWYYVFGCADVVLYWIVALPAVYHWIIRRREPEGWNRRGLVFLAAVFPVGVLLLSIPSTKRNLYLLPLVAPLACVIGSWIAAMYQAQSARRIDRVVQAVLLALVLTFSAILLPAATFLALDPTAGGMIKAEWSAFVTTKLLVCAGIAALAVLAPALAAAVAWKRKSGLSGVLIVVALALAVQSCLVGSHLLRDPMKNLHGFVTDLEELGVFERPLIAYQPDENTRAVIPFYTGKNLEYTFGSEEVRARIDQDASTRVLALEYRFSSLPADLRARLRLVRRWDYNGRRVYVLYDVVGFSPENR